MSTPSDAPRPRRAPLNGPAEGSRPRWVRRLALASAVLMAAASAIGLGVEGLYRDNALVTASWKGNDLVTLLLAAPLLGVAAVQAASGSARARLVMLGMLLYAFYAYAFYAFGAAFNALFLVYVAIVGASGTGLLLGLLDLDSPRLRNPDPSSTTTKAVAAFMVAVGLLLGAFWITTSAAFLFTGAPPAMVVATDHPTNVTGALDLTLAVPPALIGGLWLRRGRPWGYVLAVIWNVKAAAYMTALTGASVTAHLATRAGTLGQTFLWVPVGVGALISAVVLLREDPAPAATRKACGTTSWRCPRGPRS